MSSRREFLTSTAVGAAGLMAQQVSASSNPSSISKAGLDETRRVNLIGHDPGRCRASVQAEAIEFAKEMIPEYPEGEAPAPKFHPVTDDCGSWEIETAHGEIDIPADEQTPYVLINGLWMEIVHMSESGTIYFHEGNPSTGVWTASASDSWIEMFDNELLS